MTPRPLNNQNDVTVHFFFGTRWNAPMVLVVLAAFAAGVAAGVLGMLPRWLRNHRSVGVRPVDDAPESMVAYEGIPSQIPRHGS